MGFLEQVNQKTNRTTKVNVGVYAVRAVVSSASVAWRSSCANELWSSLRRLTLQPCWSSSNAEGWTLPAAPKKTSSCPSNTKASRLLPHRTLSFHLRACLGPRPCDEVRPAPR